MSGSTWLIAALWVSSLFGTSAKLEITPWINFLAGAGAFGKAPSALEGSPVDVEIVVTGQDKLRLLRRLGPSYTVAIGNGRNDVAILQKAAVGIVVIGPEGAAGDAVHAADILVRDIQEGLDLLLKPLRLKATYRR
jgi:soluble P-type ATPase